MFWVQKMANILTISLLNNKEIEGKDQIFKISLLNNKERKGKYQISKITTDHITCLYVDEGMG